MSSSVPFTTFSATKVHEFINEKKNHRPGYGNHFTDDNLDQSIFGSDPHHYSTKMMNSIWGLYNKYAPHAFQKNEEASRFKFPFAPEASKRYFKGAHF